MEFVILVLGFVFGAILQRGRLNRFNTISGLATLEDLTIAKALLVAIGVGMILLNVEIALGLAAYHVKPFLFGGVVLGGIIFGVGMAILGYCPGTLAVSLGEGSIDALFGIIGGLLGGLFYTLSLPFIHYFTGPNLGAFSLYSIVGHANFLFFLLIILVGAALIWAAFWLNKKEAVQNRGWLYAGVGLAVLNGIVFLSSVTNRPIGASTSYPYLADKMAGLTQNPYYEKIAGAGHWEFIFLIGAVLAGLVLSLVFKEFKLITVHTRWEKYKGASPGKRIGYALLGGFILIYGARMAGGCTSGHILSGGMQFAISSLVFAVFVLSGLVTAGRLFYRR